MVSLPRFKTADKKLILVLVSATVIGGITLGIISRIGVPTARAQSNVARISSPRIAAVPDILIV